MGGGGESLEDAYGAIAGAITKAGEMQAASIDRASATYERSFDKSLNMLKEQYAQGRSDLEPYRNFGGTAMTSLKGFLGLGDNGSVDMSNVMEALKKTPGYEFTVQEGQRAIQTAQSASGLLNSGQAAKDLMTYGQGMASNTYQQHVGNLMGATGIGANASAQTSSAANRQGEIMSQMQTELGSNLANAEIAKGNALSQALVNSVSTKYKYLTG